MKFLICFLFFQFCLLAKEANIHDLKLPVPIGKIKSILRNSKSIPTNNNLNLITEKNIGIIADKDNALFLFEYKTEFIPEKTTFLFNNQSKVFSKSYNRPKKVLLKIAATSKENALDKFLISSTTTLLNKLKIEVTENPEIADETISIDATVVKIPANYMRRIYLVSSDQKLNKLWEVEINSPGKLDGIRRMVPAMILSSQDFIMKNTQEKKIEISGVKVRDFFFEIVAMNLGTKHSIINY